MIPVILGNTVVIQFVFDRYYNGFLFFSKPFINTAISRFTFQKKRHRKSKRSKSNFIFFIQQAEPNNSFFENTLKKTTEYFIKNFFLLESTMLPVNNGK